MRSHYLITLALAMFVFSCTKPEEGGKVTPTPTPSPAPTTEQITIPSTVDTKPVVSSEGGELKISFTAAAAWTASVINTKADSWLDVNPKNGNPGAAEIKITTTANDTYVERNATIQIKCGSETKDIVLTQKQLDNITVTSDKVELGAEGGTFSIVLKSNIDYKYEINGDWIKEASTKAYTENTLSFSADPNEDVEKREGSVTIKGGEFSETVKVYQSGVEPSLVITQNEYNLEAEGGSIVIEVSSNVSVQMTIPSDAVWITENQTKSVSTSTFHLDVAANDTYESRSAEISFSNEAIGISENVIITQAGKACVKFNDDNFKAYCIEHFDITGDGEISLEEAHLITKIDVKTDDIYSLKGIENFTNLDTLICISGAHFEDDDIQYEHPIPDGKLSELDVTNNEKLRYLDCSYNLITSLDVTNCSELVILYVNNNQIDKIDVKNNQHLKSFYVDYCPISTLDVSNNIELEWLGCIDTKISTLDLSKNPRLKSINISNTNIATLDFSNNPDLTQVICYFCNDLQEIDLSGKVELVWFRGSGCGNLEKLNLSECSRLQKIECRSCQKLSELSLYNCSSLSEIFCNNCNLSSLDLSNVGQYSWSTGTWTYGFTIDCNNNHIKSLKLPILATIKELHCEDNEIEELEPNLKIYSLYCRNNRIKKISLGGLSEYLDASDNPYLEEVVFKSNSYVDAYLNLDNDTALTSLNVSGGLKELNLGTLSALTDLTCKCDNLTSIDLSGNPKLCNLKCECKSLKSLDLTNNLELEFVKCWRCSLETLLLPANSTLTYLSCRENQLTNIDVSQYTNLTNLYCDKNKLTNLDISNNTFLDEMSCENNKINKIIVWNGFKESEHPNFYKDSTAEYVEVGNLSCQRQ